MRIVKKSEQKALSQWYEKNQRDLPWRRTRDPYAIWISETMLQQTTTQAVIPYYEKFLSLFPNVSSLANAPSENVMAAWAGLGYYSRARNLHKAAQWLYSANRFPESYKELLELPGFGPYTARAVSSIAFGEEVGVIDGNVIRCLSRYHGLELQWWKSAGRKQLQEISDQWVKKQNPSQMNQALMEWGASLCTPSNPQCALCPLVKQCWAYEQGRIPDLPLKRPKKSRQIWEWTAVVVKNEGKIALQKNDYAPFLKNHWILPGAVRQSSKKPAQFDFKHCITHHDIFVKVKSPSNFPEQQVGKTKDLMWVMPTQLSKFAPTNLVKKAVQRSDR